MTTAITGAGTTNYIAELRNQSPDPTANLTPETLLLYCSSRLSSIDVTIKQFFAEQKSRNGNMQALGKLSASLSRWAGGHAGAKEFKEAKPPADVNAWKQDHANMANEALDVWRTSTDPEVKRRADDVFYQATGYTISSNELKCITTDTKIVPDDIQRGVDENRIPSANDTQVKGVLDSIKESQSAMSKDAELNMIQLQALVSQRQLAVQMTTQLMQSLNESTKQVAGNMGR